MAVSQQVPRKAARPTKQTSRPNFNDDPTTPPATKSNAELPSVTMRMLLNQRKITKGDVERALRHEKEASQIEQSLGELEKADAEAEKQLNARKRQAIDEGMKMMAKKRIRAVHVRTAMVETYIEMNGLSVRSEDLLEGTPEPKPSITTQSQQEYTQSSNTRLMDRMVVELDEVDKNDSQYPWPLEKRCGLWADSSAKDLLGSHIKLPLVQTCLNYLEFFINEVKIWELAQILDINPFARWNFEVLRREWGGPGRDYFAEAAEGPRLSLRASPGFYSWSVYDLKGNMDPMAKMNLGYDYAGLQNFGYETMHTENSKLHEAFLRTDYAVENPCGSHQLRLLQAKEKCKGCRWQGDIDFGLP
ncbi:hypothetical protein SLS56_011933 [Neofusicoccum ribis]|uniref:Uncharacterized protein n=1 Tax=Neofusicoccum ribis TaxID=45134 RepID=A0ABR3SA88_9PEZI